MVNVLITSTIIIVLLVIFRKLCMGKISRKLQYMLWLFVVFRLLIPVQFIGVIPNVANVVLAKLQRIQVDQYIEQVEKNVTKYNVTQYNDTQYNTAESDNRTDDVIYQEIIQLPVETVDIESRPSLDINNETEHIALNKEIITTTEKGNYRIDAVNIAKVLWILGIIAETMIVLISNLHFYNQLCKSRKLLEVKEKIPVYLSDKVATPCLYGLFKPAIYLNQESIKDEELKELIISHEMVHYHHKDYLWSVVRLICVVIYWFDPFVYVAAVLSGRDCELACDDTVLKNLDDEQKIKYGQMLLDMSIGVSNRQLVYCSAGISSGKSAIKERIKMTVSGHKNKMWLSIVVIVSFCLIAIIAFGAKKIGDSFIYMSLRAYVMQQEYAGVSMLLNPVEDTKITTFKQPVYISELSDTSESVNELVIMPAIYGMTNSVHVEGDYITNEKVEMELLKTENSVIEHSYNITWNMENCSINQKYGKYKLKTEDVIFTGLTCETDKGHILVEFAKEPLDIEYEVGEDYLILKSLQNINDKVNISYAYWGKERINTGWRLSDVIAENLNIQAFKVQIAEDKMAQLWLDKDFDGIFESRVDSECYSLVNIGDCNLDGGKDEEIPDRFSTYVYSKEPIVLENAFSEYKKLNREKISLGEYIVEQKYDVGVKLEMQSNNNVTNVILDERLHMQARKSQQIAISNRDDKQYILKTAIVSENDYEYVFDAQIYDTQSGKMVCVDKFSGTDFYEFKTYLEPWISDGILLVSMEGLGKYTARIQIAERGKTIPIHEGYDKLFDYVKVKPTTMFLSGYTGYIDENDEYTYKKYFQNLDIDNDGLIDRVYRQQLDWEFCNIEVHFGDKSTMLIEKVNDESIPDFILLPSDSNDTLIAFRNYYPGANGEVVHNDMKFFKKENGKYIETPLPFSEVSYADKVNKGGWNQYVNVNVKLVDANNRTVAYTCKEFPDFYEEITMTEEDYWAGDFALQFEYGGGNIDCSDSMVYSIDIPRDGSNTIICKAHVIYHCSDEIAFVMKYIDGKWQVLEVGMSIRTSY